MPFLKALNKKSEAEGPLDLFVPRAQPQSVPAVAAAVMGAQLCSGVEGRDVLTDVTRLREIKASLSLRNLIEVKSMPDTCGNLRNFRLSCRWQEVLQAASVEPPIRRRVLAAVNGL